MSTGERIPDISMKETRFSRISDDDVFSKLREFLANREPMNEPLSDEDRALILEAHMRNNRLIDRLAQSLNIS